MDPFGTQRKIITAYKEVFRTDRGKIVLQDLFDKCGLMKLSFFKDNPTVTAYNEGRRSIAVFIAGLLKLTTEDLDKLEKGSFYD